MLVRWYILFYDRFSTYYYGYNTQNPRDSMKKIGYSIEIKLDGFCMRLHTVNLFITGFV